MRLLKVTRGWPKKLSEIARGWPKFNKRFAFARILVFYSVDQIFSPNSHYFCVGYNVSRNTIFGNFLL